MTTKNTIFRKDTSYLKRAIIIGILDVLCICLSYSLALWLKYDFRFSAIPDPFKDTLIAILPVWCGLSILVFAAFGLYNSVWSFAGTDELFRVMGAYIVLTLAEVFMFAVLKVEMPLSFYAVGLLLSFVCTVALRFSYRLLRQIRIRFGPHGGKQRERVMIIGGGEAGRALITEFQSSAYIHSQVCCVIDDNPAKLHKRLCGVPIVGSRDQIPEAVDKYAVDRIIYAIPTSSAQTMKEIMAICSQTGRPVQVLPGIYQLVNGEISVSKLRKVDVQDLLGRDPIKVDLGEILEYIYG